MRLDASYATGIDHGIVGNTMVASHCEKGYASKSWSIRTEEIHEPILPRPAGKGRLTL